jgi:hypothetical protein
VHRSLGEQREGGRPHVTPPRSTAGAAAPTTATAEAEGLGWPLPAAVLVSFVVFLQTGSHEVVPFIEVWRSNCLVTYE